MSTPRTPGPYPVAEHDVPLWVTTCDGEPVPVWAQVPIGRDDPTVVLFSHGLGGGRHGYARLGHHLASHGHVVLHPQYADSFTEAADHLGVAPHLEHTWPSDDAARAGFGTLLTDPQYWRSRISRAHAVLDSVADQQHLDVALAGRPIVAAGHSYGAYLTQLLAGARLRGVGPDFDDSRHPLVRAAVLLSPQGSGSRGLAQDSWDELTVPLLVVTGTLDHGPLGQGLDWRREPYDRARSHTKHLAVVRDGTHQLGGIGDAAAGPAESAPEVVAAICTITSAFLADLAGDADARRWLTSHPYCELVDHEQIRSDGS